MRALISKQESLSSHDSHVHGQEAGECQQHDKWSVLNGRGSGRRPLDVTLLQGHMAEGRCTHITMDDAQTHLHSREDHSAQQDSCRACSLPAWPWCEALACLLDGSAGCRDSSWLMETVANTGGDLVVLRH